MIKTLKRTGVAWLFALSAAFIPGCGDDGEEGKGAAIAPGESHMFLELSGGDLDAPVTFEGTTSKPWLNVFDDSISVLSSAAPGVEGSRAPYHLGEFTFEIRKTSPGTYGPDDFDINLVVKGVMSVGGSDAYSIREKSGAITVTHVSADKVEVEFDFHGSPTQGMSTGLDFHLKGRFVFTDDCAGASGDLRAGQVSLENERYGARALIERADELFDPSDVHAGIELFLVGLERRWTKLHRLRDFLGRAPRSEHVGDLLLLGGEAALLEQREQTEATVHFKRKLDADEVLPARVEPGEAIRS